MKLRFQENSEDTWRDLYLDKMAAVAKYRAEQTGEDPDVILTEMLNDNRYDYEAALEHNFNIKDESDFNDSALEFAKTVYHPTFSNRSYHSGNKSQYNPKGTIGGRFTKRGEYIPSYNQVRNNDFDYSKAKKYLDENNGFISDKYKTIQLIADNPTKYATVKIKYPLLGSFLGSSSLEVPYLSETSKGDPVLLKKQIDGEEYLKNTYQHSSTLVKDALKAINSDPSYTFISTPYGVEDYVSKLNGIPAVKFKQRFNPITNSYQDSDKIDKKFGESMYYIPITEDQQNQLLKFIDNTEEETRKQKIESDPHLQLHKKWISPFQSRNSFIE